MRARQEAIGNCCKATAARVCEFDFVPLCLMRFWCKLMARHLLQLSIVSGLKDVSVSCELYSLITNTLPLFRPSFITHQAILSLSLSLSLHFCPCLLWPFHYSRVTKHQNTKEKERGRGAKNRTGGGCGHRR